MTPEALGVGEAIGVLVGDLDAYEVTIGPVANVNSDCFLGNGRSDVFVLGPPLLELVPCRRGIEDGDDAHAAEYVLRQT